MEQPFLDGALSVPRAAAVLGVTPITVARWVASGRLPAATLPSGRQAVLVSTLEQILKPGRLES